MIAIPTLDSPETIRAAMARVLPVVPFLAPVFHAAEAGHIGVVFLSDRTRRLPTRQLNRFTLPTLLVIGDDDGLNCGPPGWRSAKDAAAWAAGAIVHGTGPRTEHYAEAVMLTILSRRLLLIETGSAHVRAWGELMPHKPVLHLIPPSGEAHPAPPASGALH